MNQLTERIESILFVAARPMNVRRLAEVCGVSKDEVRQAIDEIAAIHNASGRGIRIMHLGDEVQMSTSPESSKLVQDFLKDETTGELTKPSLETLTIVAYRGPITKAELEQVRGVNCSLILRNLMMRGLVEVQGEAGHPQATYRVTMDFVRFLGISGVEDLPEYEKLRSHENVTKVLEMAGGQQPAATTDGAADAETGTSAG